MKKIRRRDMLLYKVSLVLAMILSVGHAADLVTTTLGDNGSYGCRRSFGYGVYDPAVNRTVTVWNGDNMSPFVRSFDHTTAQWADAVKTRTLTYNTTWDYHNYPTMVLAPDGHYLIFYFKHSTAAYMLRSPAPHRIQGTWAYTTVNSDKNAYPMPVVVDGSIYLFYSKSVNVGSAYRTYVYTRSDDNGTTWSTPRTVIDTKDTDPEEYDEVYLHGFAVDETRKRILLGWEMHGGPGGHNAGGKNAYYAEFDCASDKMYSAAGADLGGTIDLTELLDDCLVASGKDAAAIPFGYTTFPVLLSGGTPAVLYRYSGTTYIARWSGGAWTETVVSGINSPVDYQQDKDGSYVILNRETSSSMAVWRSSNGYSGWSKEHTGGTGLGNGATSLNAGFMDDFDPGVVYMCATYNHDERTSDYSGKWPVSVGGTAAASEPVDTMPPTVTGAAAVDAFSVLVTFSERIGDGAGSAANYSVTPGIDVNSATVQADGRSVLLNTSGMTLSSMYAVSVTNVKDAAAPANTIGSGNRAEFTYEDCTASTASWQSRDMGVRSGTFGITYTAVPQDDVCNAVFALSSAPADEFTDCAVLVRFNEDGAIDARNGGDYAAVSALPYVSGTEYSFDITVDADAHRYDVTVTPAGGAAAVIARNYAFRSEQGNVSSLRYWNMQDDAGVFKVCDVTVEPRTSGMGQHSGMLDAQPVAPVYYTLSGIRRTGSAGPGSGIVIRYDSVQGARAVLNIR